MIQTKFNTLSIAVLLVGLLSVQQLQAQKTRPGRVRFNGFHISPEAAATGIQKLKRETENVK